ncbi:hypothetical protein LCGC14_1210860 [marine sediment metagenome]|uniref:GP-PDE domain-containing protein n=1 Tax=marine sediment metagenome TaxID=412755 RepID=A0A0F9M1G8_9ZZZZ
MILIAHRGNINGPNIMDENKPSYIEDAIDQGYDVEIDVWLLDGKYYLGHDEPSYVVGLEFLGMKSLWIHCKNYEALQDLSQRDLNVFFHTDEDYVLTSKNYIWAYPGKLGNKHTICVMPEWGDYSIDGFAGVCSDYIGDYK